MEEEERRDNNSVIMKPSEHATELCELPFGLRIASSTIRADGLLQLLIDALRVPEIAKLVNLSKIEEMKKNFPTIVSGGD